jgi:transcriptional regulator with XRE-family HTH domain
MAGITGATLSRFERYQRLPDPKTLFACEVAFGVPLQQFAKRLYREVEAETRTRAAKIRERVAKANGKPSRLLELKLKTLERISESAKAHADAIVS